VFDESLKRQSSPTQEFTVDLVEPLPVDNLRPPVPRYIPCNLNVMCLEHIKVLDACGKFPQMCHVSYKFSSEYLDYVSQ
jgi:hypothetical protein